MDFTGSITNFFYNLLPGIYFWALLPSSYKQCIFEILDNNHNNDSNLELVIYVGLIFLLGFIFQGLTKIIRKLFLDEKVIKSVIADNNHGKIWNRAKKLLDNIYDADTEKDIELFYLMDNYINSSKTNILPTHFSHRTSLWSNLFWANLFLILLNPYLANNFLFFIFSFIIVPLITLWNFKSQQDTIIKSFVMEHNNFAKE